MFVQNLNQEQQKLLLSCSYKLISIDGKDMDKELALLDVIKAQCHSTIQSDLLSPEDLSDDFIELKGKFHDKKEKVSFMLELIGMAWVDDDYSEREKSQIKKVCSVLQISTETLEDLEDWVQRQYLLVYEAQFLMEE